jgi:cytochrome b6-f complex iron-sulfur subunit
MERKEFVKFLAASVASGSLVSYLASCKKESTAAPNVDFTLDLTASANAMLLTSGGSLVSNKVIVINNSGSYVALSDECTHEGCAVSYNSSSNNLQCPCHGGVFSISGSVVSGPPPKSLKQYTVSKNGNSLHISG